MLRLLILLSFFSIASAEPWEETSWLKLLHYKKTTFGYISAVKSQDFFLTKDGRTDPKSEFLEFKKNLENINFRCKFLARTKYISKILNKNFDPYTECQDYLEWYNIINPKGITLIFPSVYLNNPASAFGHTLIRIDSDDPEIVQYAVNFSAQTNGESSLLYAFKGVFGGYNGRFTVAPYYTLVKKYNDYESRDIWEYKLNFDQNETNNLVEHLWELQQIDFSYYYFDENCSYHLLGLLDTTRENLDLTSKYSIWVLPLDTVQEMTNLITSSKLRTSVTEDIYRREKEVVEIPQIKKYIKTQDLDSIKNSNSLLLLQDYLSYLTTKGKISEEESRKLSYKLYQKISQTEEVESQVILKEDPIKHHKYNKISLDLFNQELEFKPAYHGLLDPKSGAEKTSALDLIKIRIDHKFKTKRFDLVEIYSLAPRGELIKPLSYKLNLFYEDEKIRRKVIDFGFGLTNKINNLILYSLMKTTPTYAQDDFFFGLGNETGLIFDDKYGRSLIQFTALSYLNGESLKEFNIARTIPVNDNFQFSLGYNKNYNFNSENEIIRINLEKFF